MSKYFETTSFGDSNSIKVSVDYRLGGWNSFTHSEEKRGIYVSFMPVKIIPRDGYNIEEYSAFSGVRYLVRPLGRKSQAAIDQIEKAIEPILQDLVSMFELRDNDGIVEALCSLIEDMNTTKLYVVCSDRIWKDNLVCVCKSREEAEMVEEKWRSFPDRMRVRIVTNEPSYPASWYKVSEDGKIVKIR